MTPISEYRYRRRVEFAETDLAGVVHFSWFFRYMEEAEHALWRAAGLTIAPRDSDIGFPRVSASLDFLAPLHFEDELEVWIRIEAINRRSIRYVSTMTCDGTTVATGTVTAACVRKSPPPMRAIDLPEPARSRLAAYVSGEREPARLSETVRDRRLEAIYSRLSAGESFRTAVGEPYLERELNRADVQFIVRKGLNESANDYAALLERFNLTGSEHQRFMDFLRQHRLKPS